ncbi:MAG: hotdog fold thioesterase [Desulfotomaculaceae bacterium]|nr:hotdog fold thioesterase [Desulfotomaculaceae bacterium]
MGSIQIDRERLEKDALAQLMGIKINDIQAGYASATMEVRKELLNALGFTHGGAIFSLLDVVFAAASNSHGPVAVALNVNINFLKATKEGVLLTATAREENLTRKTGLYRLEVRDESGDIVALAEGLVYRPKPATN